jgi:hypothetical protein
MESGFPIAAQWVVRLDLDGRMVHEPLRCLSPDAVIAAPGLRMLEQCVICLLTEGESAESHGNRRAISDSGQTVGYIEITNSKP